ncbi:unnamed protein product, partial [Eruca vesicaria subsp. sativa]|nr:unnamed protein product [Eruca vesicaria subsp. sativa]
MSHHIDEYDMDKKEIYSKLFQRKDSSQELCESLPILILGNYRVVNNFLTKPLMNGRKISFNIVVMKTTATAEKHDMQNR